MLKSDSKITTHQANMSKIGSREWMLECDVNDYNKRLMNDRHQSKNIRKIMMYQTKNWSTQ